MVSLREMMEGAWIEGEQLGVPGDKFVEQLVDILIELHSSPYTGPDRKKFPAERDVADLIACDDKDDFTKQAIDEYFNLDNHWRGCLLHGDLWRQNILVDEDGNLTGLRDWEDISVGDPNWDLRMVRRWLGWERMDKLIFLYNSSMDFNLDKNSIMVYDKISLCHSIRIRKKRGLLRHDKDFAIQRFEEYKRIFPECLPLDWKPTADSTVES
jgi:aminoglycoside phosphotransferase (APT) family kinase protein